MLTTDENGEVVLDENGEIMVDEYYWDKNVLSIMKSYVRGISNLK